MLCGVVEEGKAGALTNFVVGTFDCNKDELEVELTLEVTASEVTGFIN